MLPIFISVQPSDIYFAWEAEVQINNFRKFGYSSRMHILIYDIDPEDPARIRYRKYWNRLQEKYPEVQIFFYPDKGIKNLMKMYIPMLQSHVLAQHFEAYPELEKEVIFRHDTDMLFIKPIDFDSLMGDDTCYLSDTVGYLGIDYLDSKVNDVLPNKLEKYKKIDVVEQATSLVGISREIITTNNKDAGGAQYLLKGINADFWRKVERDSFPIWTYLTNVNRTYFPSQEKGFQAWTADMWSVLWNLWYHGKKTVVHPELDFCWPTDRIEKWDTCKIFHNAGVTHTKKVTDNGIDHHLFYKGDIMYKKGIITPFDMDKKEWEKLSRDYCSYKYIDELLSVEDPICVITKDLVIK